MPDTAQRRHTHQLFIMHCLSDSTQALQTLTKSTSMLMSGIHKRWLTVREMLMVQGFPVDTQFTYGQACSSYALRWLDTSQGRQCIPWQSRHAMCEHAGDSMHTSVSGLVILFVLTQVMLSPEMVHLQRFVMLRNLRMEQCHQKRASVKDAADEDATAQSAQSLVAKRRRQS